MTSSSSSAFSAQQGTPSFNDADRAIFAAVTAPISHKMNLKAIEGLSEELSEVLVNLIQNALDQIRSESRLPSPQLGEQILFRRRAMRLLVTLSIHYNIFPDGLFVTGVTCKQTLDPLVRGGFADIFEGESNGLKVAMKRLRTYGNATERDKIHDMVRREATLWRQLDHPNVLPLLGIDSTTFSQLYALVSPWMPNGSLVEYISGHKIDTPVIHQLLREVAEGLQYLHDQDIIHGDLRAANVLINDAKQACLADFGLARVSSATTTVTSTVPHSNARWLAPELLDGEVEAPNTRSDVFALGRVCLEAYTQKVPFWYIAHEAGVITKLLKGEDVMRPNIHECDGRKLSDEFWHVLQETWAEDPLARPTAAAFIHKLEAMFGLLNPQIPNEPLSAPGLSFPALTVTAPKGSETTKRSLAPSTLARRSRSSPDPSLTNPILDGIPMSGLSQIVADQVSKGERQRSSILKMKSGSISEAALVSSTRIPEPPSSPSSRRDITAKWKSIWKFGRRENTTQLLAHSSASVVPKILLLGPSGGGKSTLLKHLKLHYAPWAFDAELNAWRAVIELTLVRAVNAVISPATSLDGIGAGLADLVMQVRTLCQATLHQVEEVLRLRLQGTKTSCDAPGEVSVQGGIGGRRWKTLAHGKVLKGSANRRPDSAKDDQELTEARQGLNACVNDIVRLGQSIDLSILSEPEQHYVSCAKRICQEYYAPTDEDILRSRLWTHQIEEHRFAVDSGGDRRTDIVVYDFNGQLGLPAHWGPYLDEVSVVFFVVPMADFDRTVAGCSTKRYLDDAVLKWQEICGNPRCTGKKFVVVLNQMDLLAAKLNKGVQFATHVPAYGDGPNEYKSVVKFIHRLFVEVYKRNAFIRKDKILFHASSATNVGSMSKLFQSVRDLMAAPDQEDS